VKEDSNSSASDQLEMGSMTCNVPSGRLNATELCCAVTWIRIF